MSNSIILDDEFKRLYQPIHKDKLSRMKRNLISDKNGPVFIVWNDILIDDYYKYEICIANCIHIEKRSITFSTRNAVISWICINQLRRSDLTPEYRRYLIGKRYDAEKDFRNANSDGTKIHRKPNETNAAFAARRIGICYNISPNSISKYASYAKAIECFNAINPIYAQKILQGDFFIPFEYAIKLSSLTVDRIVECFTKLEAGGKGIRFYDVFKQVSENYTGDGPKPISVVNIKTMPKYDPDAVFSSLRLTIPSWISSIERVSMSEDIFNASDSAKEQLVSALQSLKNNIDVLIEFIMEVKSDE